MNICKIREGIKIFRRKASSPTFCTQRRDNGMVNPSRHLIHTLCCVNNVDKRAPYTHKELNVVRYMFKDMIEISRVILDSLAVVARR